MASSYRADIDGLRALAIIPVVLFHSGLSALSGGFTGVDIFFVISGFLITGILSRELREREHIDFAQFYARRIARIFPSLLLVVSVTVLSGALLLSAALFEIHSLAKSAIASLGFVANFYFLNATGDYFAQDGRGLPLLHTWSLAVEEQYYLVWPLILVWGGAIGRRFGNVRLACVAMIIVISVISMASSAWLTIAAPTSAFYLSTSRAWELGMGSALVLVERVPGKREAEVSGASGLALILSGFLFAKEGNSFPFPLALLPCLGTVLMIWAGRSAGQSTASRLLSVAPLRSIGRVSYAWYLWHWPPLAFAYLLTMGQAPIALKLCLAGFSLGLSYVTVSVVENPIRFGLARRKPRRTVILGGIGAAFAVMGLSTGTYVAAKVGLLPGDSRIAAAFQDRPSRQETCLLRRFPAGLGLPAACTGSAHSPHLVLWGDSHADQWSPSLDAWAKGHRGWRIDQATLAACPPLLALTPTDPQGAPHQPLQACRRMNDLIGARIGTETGPTVVVLAGNWLPRAGFEIPGTNTQYFDMRATTGAESLRYLALGIERTLHALNSRGIPAVVVLQAPVQELNPAACVQRLGNDRCFVARAKFERNAQIVNAVLRRAAKRFSLVQVLDPMEILCTLHSCNAQIDGRIAYFDSEHVAASFAASPRALSRWTPILDRAIEQASVRK